VYYGTRDIRLEDIDIPEIGPEDVLLKVKVCGICGSDLHSYRYGVFSRSGWIMGHELAGEVIAVGDRVRDIQKGDRMAPFGGHLVSQTPGCGNCFWCLRGQSQYCESRPGGRHPCGKCDYCVSGKFYLCKEIRRYQDIGYSRNGGNAEYVAVWHAILNDNVYRLPDDISYDEGAALEPLAGVIRWVALAKPQAYDTAVVIGLGTIGLLTMQVLKSMVSRVIVCEKSQRRLQVARELGADVVIDVAHEDPVKKVAEVVGMGRSNAGRGGARADFVMECSGAGVALSQAMEMTRAGGRVVLVGLYEKAVTIDPNLIIFKDIHMISSQSYSSREPEGNPILQGMDLIKNSTVKIKPLISHEFPLEKINEAFETQAKPDESVKVLIKTR
jgi:threonine dehydrogenase-like Zn-dependent dehydrogenase